MVRGNLGLDLKRRATLIWERSIDFSMRWMGSCYDMDVTQPGIELQDIGNTNDFEAQIPAPIRTRFTFGSSLLSEV